MKGLTSGGAFYFLKIPKLSGLTIGEGGLTIGISGESLFGG